MDDINLLAGAAKDDKNASGPKKARDDDLQLHVPVPEVPEKPALVGGKFLSQLIESEKAAALPPEKILSQKIEPIKPPPSPRPPASPPPPPPKPPTPPPPKQPEPQPEESGGGILRVSLISTGGGAGLSDLALRSRLRTFALAALGGLILNGLIFAGLALAKSSVEKRNADAERLVQEVTQRIAAKEADLKSVRDFQALSKAAARVLDAHTHWTEVLRLLEERALPQVRFGGVAGAETGTLSFEVDARDYATLARQIVAFRQDSRVKKVSVGTASAGVGESGLVTGVHASMTLTLDPGIFRFNPSAVSSATSS